MKKINYPYEIPGKPYQYVPITNKFMQVAMDIAKTDAYDTGYEPKSPVGVVFVRNGKVLVKAADGSDYHIKNGCERVKLGTPSGQDYHLCPGCDYENHAEPKAINLATEKGIDIKGADAYLFGEWWCCKPCSEKMLKAGINNIYLLEDSEKYFNRALPTCKNGDFEFFYQLIKNEET